MPIKKFYNITALPKYAFLSTIQIISSDIHIFFLFSCNFFPDKLHHNENDDMNVGGCSKGSGFTKSLRDAY